MNGHCFRKRKNPKKKSPRNDPTMSCPKMNCPMRTIHNADVFHAVCSMKAKDPVSDARNAVCCCRHHYGRCLTDALWMTEAYKPGAHGLTRWCFRNSDGCWFPKMTES